MSLLIFMFYSIPNVNVVVVALVQSQMIKVSIIVQLTSIVRLLFKKNKIKHCKVHNDTYKYGKATRTKGAKKKLH